MTLKISQLNIWLAEWLSGPPNSHSKKLTPFCLDLAQNWSRKKPSWEAKFTAPRIGVVAIERGRLEAAAH